MRAVATVGWLLVALAAFGCEGGQTGTPSSIPRIEYDAGCPRSPADVDAATPFGYPPSVLLDAFVGTHEVAAYWRLLTVNEPGVPSKFDANVYDDPTPENAVALTIEIEPAADFRLPPARCDIRLSVPVDVTLTTDDGLLSTHFAALLLGNPGHARIEIDEDESATVTGTIDLGANDAARVDLAPLGDQARRLVAPFPCSDSLQRPLDDPRWSLTPATILAALNGRTDAVHFDPVGDVQLRVDLVAARATACGDGPTSGSVPVQLTLTDVERNQPLLSLLGTFLFGQPCTGESFYPSMITARICSGFDFLADGDPAIERWKFWPAPAIEPQRVNLTAVHLYGEYRFSGALTGRALLGFFYNGGTPEGASTGASWRLDAH